MSELIRIDEEIAAVIADAERAATIRKHVNECPHPAGSRMEKVWREAYFRKWEEVYSAAQAA